MEHSPRTNPRSISRQSLSLASACTAVGCEGTRPEENRHPTSALVELLHKHTAELAVLLRNTSCLNRKRMNGLLD